MKQRTNEQQVSRRQFVRRSIGCTAALFPAFVSPRAFGNAPPSDQVTIGCIGMGNHGIHRNLKMLLAQQDARVVAVCDVFDDRTMYAQDMVNKKYKNSACASFVDFRKIIDRSDIDAVMISAPDHWHVPMSVLAIRAGKDVICEKPTLTIKQGRILCDTVKKHKAVFQTSTEDRSMKCYHQMAQIVRNGLIGKVKQVKVQLPAGQKFPNEDPLPVPKGLHWDLWLGPAPYAPYTKNRTERQHWRHVWDYSGGKFSDWGMHQLDTMQWALDMEKSGPEIIDGKGTINEGSMYNTFITYKVNYTYRNGVQVEVKSGGTSLRFEGADGWVGNSRFAGPLQASSEEILQWKPGYDAIKLYTNPRGEHRDFLDCVKTRKDPYFPAETGHRCATLLHAGNISMRLGRKLKWDPEKEEFHNDPEANKMKSCRMRKPWTLDA